MTNVTCPGPVFAIFNSNVPYRLALLGPVLIPTLDARHFLRVYVDLLSSVAGRELKTADDFLGARDSFFAGPARDKPPTKDRDLLDALASASYGDFTVARHLARYSEMVGPDGRAYQVRGITTEPKDLLPSWSMVRTAVLRFRGEWIYDGLIGKLGVRVGPGMKRGILAACRQAAAAAPSEPPPSAKSDRPPYTEKQGQYLAYIHQYTKKHGQPPAQADIQRHFKVSPPSVHQMILHAGTAAPDREDPRAKPLD